MNSTKIFLLIFLLISASINLIAQSFGGGDGSTANPYQIATKAQLLDIKNYSTQNFVLVNDIDFMGDAAYPQAIIPSMAGNFNGAGYKISNITFEGSISFLGTVETTSRVFNLHLRNITFTHNEYSGATTRAQNQDHAPFANTNKGNIENCSFSSNVAVGGYTNVAGFVLSNSGTIKNCYVNSDVTAHASYNVSGTWFAGRNVSGFVSTNNNIGIIENCYYIGAVNTGDYSTGGFVLTNNGTIRNSFSLATSVVSPEYGSAVHRFANSNTSILQNNYARKEMTLNGTPISSSDAASIEAKDIEAAVLNQADTYTAQGWDFTNNWTIAPGDPYPTLRIFNIVLPVTFGSIAAKIANNQLAVYWSSLTEISCRHYLVQAGAEGQEWKTLDVIPSKAANGHSDSEIKYEYQTPLNAALSGIMAVFILSFISSFRKNQRSVLYLRLIAFVALLSALSNFSCSKQEFFTTNESAKVYIRIIQVDKDGTQQVSKVVQAVREE